MREALQKIEGQRKKFYAVFERLGKKINFKGYAEETILLKNVVDTITNKVVAGHIWFAYSKSFQQAKITEGMEIEFEARITQYTKGYVNRQHHINNRKTDFKLSHPTKIRRRDL